MTDVPNIDLSDYFTGALAEAPDGDVYAAVMKPVERELLRRVGEHYRGNQVRMARTLGINRNTLRKKLKEHEMDVGTRRGYRQPAAEVATR
jgi:DNA-binding protein Fis